MYNSAVHAYSAHERTHVYIYNVRYVYNKYSCKRMYVCMYVRMYVCMYVGICMYVRMYVCMHVMYVCMYVCVYVCRYVH